MLFLALSVSICTLATTLLFKGASSRWFYTLAFTSFAIYFFGKSSAFIDESSSFLSSCFMFFIGLANYYSLEEEDSENISKERDNLGYQKFIARLLIVVGFGFPIIYDDILRVQWVLLDEYTQAKSLLFVYMSVVGFFLLRRTRVKESELEP